MGQLPFAVGARAGEVISATVPRIAVAADRGVAAQAFPPTLPSSCAPTVATQRFPAPALYLRPVG